MKIRMLSIFVVVLLVGSALPSLAAFVVPNKIDNSVPVNPPTKNISTALSEFRHLSKKERKSRIRDAKAEIKKFRAEKKAGNDPSTNQVLLVILAIILPPLAVYLHEGVINNKFWLDLVLTLLFFIPGVIYALIVVLS